MSIPEMTHPGLVAAMSRPEFYPHRPEKVELIQTHISYIFIAGEYVYKVKKAVDFGFLDFTTLEKRRFYCAEELRLNRRLAPETYLEVVEIKEATDGRIILEKGGRVIDYAVKMRIIPQETMLKKLLSQGKVDRSVMDAVAGKLVDFHAKADTGGRIDEIGGIKTIRINHDENFEQTESYIEKTIPEHQYRFIKSYVYDFLDRNKELLARRVIEHRIRDCHGDLHLEHICITGSRSSGERDPHRGKDCTPDDIIIFDCIEFNERFRYEDVAAEVAFLAMDLDFNGYPDFADAFVHSYIRHSSDRDISQLLNFYRCYYAYVRGKVVGFRMHDRAIPKEDRDQAVKTASRYFDLAYTYAARPERPTLILMAGLMGTGKSVRAKNIAPRIGADIIQTDVLRKEILNIEPTERHHVEFGKGIYSEDITRMTYGKALELALEKLRDGRSVIIDASYKNREYRLSAYNSAQSINADFFVVECTCPEDIIKKRLHSRLSSTKQASDGRWELFETQKQSFHAITEIPARSHIVIDASLPPDECTCRALRKMKSFPP